LGGDGVGSADSLWLESEPSAREVLRELGRWSFDDYGELVFCGYGEPFCALDVMLDVCRALRAGGGPKIRINTNGLGDLINGKPTARLLSGLADSVSISLNAPDARRYEELCAPEYGESAFPAILRFAEECKKYVREVTFTVVDVIPSGEIGSCGALASKLGIPLRVRAFD
jgi:TatD family-associated radical SAM protein